MHISLTLFFWASLLGLVYAYAGYPLLVLLVARLHCSATDAKVVTKSEANARGDETLPELTVLISAYNAEQHICERIENILECDYPRDRLNVLVASDGSTDETVAAVKAMGIDRVSTLAFARRRGKVATLASAVQRVGSEVIVFTDASNRFDPQALKQLASHFHDPQIGLVTGKVTIVDEQGLPSESLYWKSEMMVRHCEARLGIMLGASGAIYAIRREMFVPPVRPIINDDLVLPMLVHLKHGCRFVFDDSARAYVTSVGGIASEFSRRCRIGSGAFQCLPLLGDLLRWRNKKQAFAFASHKLLRWLCPFLLIALFASNFALMSAEGYEAFLWIQTAAYAVAVCGLFAPRRGFVSKVARTASSFLFMNLALLVGFLRWTFNPQVVTWNPTRRPQWSQLQEIKNV